ncbi:MAG: crossover junction endodeoxyribonuclease RuvC [Dehalococcoidia bacterium]|nr:crossover junction endodeoxyribonuclease RuvC [Dehalococcoidia bacterium]
MVLGIDPGLRVTGFGVLCQTPGSEPSLIDCGALRVNARLPLAERLAYLYDGLRTLIERCQPSEVAVEEPFVAANVRSAMAIGEARALALLAAAQAGVPVCRYSPAEVKQSVTGYGRGSKGQVQEMVRLQLGMTEAPEPQDAADALAVALCHLARCRTNDMLREGTQT